MLSNCGAGEDEGPLGSTEIKSVNPEGNQPWIFIRRTDAEAPILWLPEARSWIIGKDPVAGKDWGQEEKRAAENELVGWHHRLNGHEFEQTLGDDEGQGSLACCSPWGQKESDTTERLNNNKRERRTEKLLKILRQGKTCPVWEEVNGQGIGVEVLGQKRVWSHPAMRSHLRLLRGAAYSTELILRATQTIPSTAPICPEVLEEITEMSQLTAVHHPSREI